MWTGEGFCERLIEAFRSLPSAPVYSPARGRLEWLELGPNDVVPGLALIVATGEILGGTSKDRAQLLAWARSQAGIGASFRSVCQELGWSRKGFYSRKDEICDLIAFELNRRRGKLDTGTDNLRLREPRRARG
jgi:hypothetical protein